MVLVLDAVVILYVSCSPHIVSEILNHVSLWSVMQSENLMYFSRKCKCHRS